MLSMVIFTVRTIFFGVLRKCYKITVSHSNLYLEFPYSFWRTFFSVREENIVGNWNECQSIARSLNILCPDISWCAGQILWYFSWCTVCSTVPLSSYSTKIESDIIRNARASLYTALLAINIPTVKRRLAPSLTNNIPMYLRLVTKLEYR